MVLEPLIPNRVVKDGDLRLHPIVTRPVDAETLEKMGASKAKREED